MFEMLRIIMNLITYERHSPKRYRTLPVYIYMSSFVLTVFVYKYES